MEFDVENAKRILKLKTLASDMCNHYVFTSYHIPEAKADAVFQLVFPVAFAGKDFKDRVANDDIGLIYEYMNKARDKSEWVDGIPTFNSFQVLTKAEADMVRGFVNAIMAEKENGKSKTD